jgi:DNA-binding MarR family transcriptional regulator
LLRERILLHLLRHGRIDEAYAPGECTQKGIARSLGANKTYVCSQLSLLEAEGLIERSTCRVRGERRKVGAYSLTEKGRRRAEALRAGL